MFKMVDLRHLGFWPFFGGPKMGSLKSPCTTSYRHHSCKLLFFEKIAFFLYFGDRQTNGCTGPLHEAALAVVSGGLITREH